MRTPWQLDQLNPNPKLVGASRVVLASLIRHVFDSWYGNSWAEVGACLHWTHAACCVLRCAGYRAILQAGTMHWPIYLKAPAPEPTHFAYQWEPQSEPSQQRAREGGLMETHVWCGLPDQGEIVDFSTCGFKQIATARHGFTWVEEDPPEFLWCPANALPEGVYYLPHIDAIRYVIGFLESKDEQYMAFA